MKPREAGRACALVQGQLKAYIDKEVDWFGRRRIARHLRTCSGCQRELEVMQKLTDRVKSRHVGETIDPPDDFKTRVMARIAAEIQSSKQEHSRAYRPERRFSAWAPVFAFVAGAMLMWIAHHRTQVSSARDTSVSIVRLRLQVSDRSAIERALAGFGPISRRTSSPQTFIMRVPQENVRSFFERLSQHGKILEPTPTALALPKVDGWVEVQIALVTR